MSIDTIEDLMTATVCNSLGDPIPLKNVSITGNLKGALFEAQVRQSFHNPRKIPTEVVYSFPLPIGAVLLGVEAQLGQVKLSGSVIATPEATERYEDALSQGDAAIMLEQAADGTYVLNLGNLLPKEECIITLTYGQLLDFEQGGLRLAIPTVIAPRFGDPIRDGGLAPHQVPDTDVLAEYGFSLSLTLHDALAHARVASPSHPISVARAATGQQLTVSLAKQSYLDRDFILVLDQLAETSLLTVGPDYADPNKFVATASFCPSIPQTETHPTSVKILVDCSGSMNGGSIAAARRALVSVLKQLKTGDKFSLSKFGSSVEHGSRALWSVTDQSRVSAENWITQLHANMGGTHIPEALESTLALGNNNACDVLLITDGQTHEINSIIERANKSKQRIFTVGIGASPSQGLLHRLAAATGAACDFIAAGEAVEPAIVRMFNRLRSPSLQNIQVQWPKDCAPTKETALAQALFDGDTVHVSAWFDQAPTGRVTLSGHVAGQEVAHEIGFVEFNAVAEDKAEVTAALASALSRIAAAQSLTELDNEALDDEALDNETLATQIAVAYQLVTEHTNFLMVHERSAADKATQMPVLHKVPQMLPAGWGGTSQDVSLMCDSISFARSNYSSPRDVPQMSIRNLSASVADFSMPSLLRNPRKTEPASDKKIVRDTTHYEVPAFLRRQGHDYTPVYNLGDILKIKADSIWFVIDQNQEKILALITDHPSDPGIRVWFTNAQHEVFDYLDFGSLEEALTTLRQHGFEDQVKNRFSLLSRFRTRYIWKCEDHTRRYMR
jgi:Ca-activated chloride channel family protein